MSEWQPIETAPEKTTILLWQPGRVQSIDIGRLERNVTLNSGEVVTYYWGSGYLADRSNSQWREPTHWMPLPEPPK